MSSICIEVQGFSVSSGSPNLQVCHRGGAGAGIVFVTSQGEVLPYSFTLTKLYSNNVVEYQTLILWLEMAVHMKQLQLQVFGDSQLVVNQLLGRYEVKKPELRPYHDYAKNLMGWLGDVTIHHVPRKENKKADALATLASSLTLLDQAQVTVCKKWVVPPPNEAEGEENELKHLVTVSEVEKEEWRQPIIDYLCYGILPANPRRRTEIRRCAPRFLYYIDTLYRKFTSKWDGPYVVQEAYSSGAYKLVDADGMRIGPINGKFLKKYYPSSYKAP
ncbi:uncharacterized protein [Nicotiana sylvestris]|uniref:uncharacterized protein n=1 Tax=Nicotiana sylvestris TaxID=4096 RepID=UPI00388C8784